MWCRHSSSQGLGLDQEAKVGQGKYIARAKAVKGLRGQGVG